MNNKVYLRLESDFRKTKDLTLTYDYDQLLEETQMKAGAFKTAMTVINRSREKEYTILVKNNQITVTRSVSSLDDMDDALLEQMSFIPSNDIIKVASRDGQVSDKVCDWKHKTLPLVLFFGKNDWFYDMRNHKWIHPDVLSKTIFLLENTPDVQAPFPQPAKALPTVQSLPQPTAEMLDKLEMEQVFDNKLYRLTKVYGINAMQRGILTDVINAERFSCDEFTATVDEHYFQQAEALVKFGLVVMSAQQVGWKFDITMSVGPNLWHQIKAELLVKGVLTE